MHTCCRRRHSGPFVDDTGRVPQAVPDVGVQRKIANQSQYRADEARMHSVVGGFLESWPGQAMEKIIDHLGARESLQLRTCAQSVRASVGPACLGVRAAGVASCLGVDKTVSCLLLFQKVFPGLERLALSSFEEFNLEKIHRKMDRALAIIQAPWGSNVADELSLYDEDEGVCIGEVLAEVAKFAKLKSLAYNTAEKVLDAESLLHVASLRNLCTLSLNAPVSDSMLGSIARGCPDLACLNLHVPGTIGDVGLGFLAKQGPPLTNIKLRGCSNSDLGLADVINACHLLRDVECSDMEVGRSSLDAMTVLSGFARLHLVGCRGVTNDAIREVLLHCNKLVDLTMSECSPGFLNLSHHSPSIQSLFLENQRLCGSMLEFAKWPRMQRLFLYGYQQLILEQLQTAGPYLRHFESVTWSCGCDIPPDALIFLQQTLSPCQLFGAHTDKAAIAAHTAQMLGSTSSFEDLIGHQDTTANFAPTLPVVHPFPSDTPGGSGAVTAVVAATAQADTESRMGAELNSAAFAQFTQLLADSGAVDDEVVAQISPEEAAHIQDEVWASSVQSLCSELEHQSNIEEVVDNEQIAEPDHIGTSEKIHVLRFGSAPSGGDNATKFREELLNGVQMRPYREALQVAGHDHVLPQGSIILVHPEQYQDARHALTHLDFELHPFHVIVTESVEYLISEILERLPFQKRPRVKKGSRGKRQLNLTHNADPQEPSPEGHPSVQTEARLMHSTSVDDDAYDKCHGFIIDRTFICVSASLRRPQSVVQSTTELVSRGLNPRRKI